MSQPISKAALGIQKELIRECMRNGVGIEFLDDAAPTFRLVPPPETVADREALDSYAKPSKRHGHSIKCRNRRNCACKFSKWYKHKPLDASPMYFQPMAGDSEQLTKARNAYHNGHPEALREWLRETAEDRRSTWAAIDSGCTTRNSGKMTAEQFKRIMSDLGFTVETLAPVLGVGWRTVFRYVGGDTSVPEPVARLMLLLQAHARNDAANAMQALYEGRLK